MTHERDRARIQVYVSTAAYSVTPRFAPGLGNILAILGLLRSFHD